MEIPTEENIRLGPEKSAPSSQSQSVPTYSSSSKLFCFICLRECERDHVDFSNDNESQNDYLLHLRNISRFLKLFHNDKDNKSPICLEENLSLSKFLLFICQDCSKSTRDFTELFQLFDEVKLQLSFYIQRICDVMTKVKTEPEEVKVRFYNENLLAKLRNQMTREMANVNSLPRVVLHKLQMKTQPDQPLPVKSEPEPEPLPIVNIPMPMPPQSKGEGELVPEPSSKSTTVNFTQAANIPEPSQTKKELVPSSSPSQRTTTTVPLNSTQAGKITAAVAPSLDKVNQSIKNESVPEPFQVTVSFAQSESANMNISAQSLAKAKSEPEPVQVHYSKFSSSSLKRPAPRPQLRNVLMGKRKRSYPNYPNPMKKLKGKSHGILKSKSHPVPVQVADANVRKAVDVNAKLMEFKWTIESESCSYCNFKLNDSENTRFDLMTKHFVKFHPEHYFLDVRDQAGGVTEMQFQRIIADILFPELYPKNVADWSCEICKFKFNNSKSKGDSDPEDIFVVLKIHALHWHTDALKERLKDFQKDPELEGKLRKANPNGEFCKCKMYFPNWHSTVHKQNHEKYFCKSDPKGHGKEDGALEGCEGMDENNAVVVVVDADAEDENYCGSQESDVAMVMGIASQEDETVEEEPDVDVET